MLAIPARVIATSFALICFAATIIVGLSNGNDWTSILASALLVCFIALMVGSILGSIILRGVNEQIEKHRAENPIPDEDDVLQPDASQAGAG